MNFGVKSGPKALRGASKKEISKEELLRKAKLDRELRAERRLKIDAAVCIQRFWRGGLARRQVTFNLFNAWLTDFGPVVSSSDQIPPPEILLGKVIPPVLHCVLPPLSARVSQLKSTSEGLNYKIIYNTAVIRGTLALIIRSVTCADETKNFFSLLHHRSPQKSQNSQIYLQCSKILLMCSGIIGNEELMDDLLLQAAASKTLQLLTDTEKIQSLLPEYKEDIAVFMSRLLKTINNYPCFYKCFAKILISKNTQDESHKIYSFGKLVNGISSVILRLMSCDDKKSNLDTMSKFSNILLTLDGLFEILTQKMSPKKLEMFKGVVMDNLHTILDSIIQSSSTPLALQIYCVSNLSKLLLVKSNDITKSSKINILEFLKFSYVIIERAIMSLGSEDTEIAMERLKPFSQRFLIKLLANGKDETLFLAKIYSLLLHRCGQYSAKENVLMFLNAIAFHPEILQNLWIWLSINLGYPLEAPFEATRGWTVESAKTSFALLSQDEAEVLSVFCQAYSHLLLVLDDKDFHTEQRPFSLGQNRAIATTLNTLVFYTHCPMPKDSSMVRTSGNSLKGPCLTALEEFVPLLLRRLYERDARKRFCTELVWLGPYRENEEGQMGFLASAVVQALLSRTSPGGFMAENDGIGSVTSSRAHGLSNLLLYAPQCVPFEKRVEVFRGLIKADKQANRWDVARADGGQRPTEVTIRRTHLFNDAMRQLGNLGELLKGRLSVSFIDAFGIEEPGVDHGGLMVELIEEIMKAGLNPDVGLFKSNSEGYLFPNPMSDQLPNGQKMLNFIGQILGKALYEGLLLNVPLAPFFLLILQNRTLMFDDLSGLDADLHKSLIQVKHYSGDARDLGLYFTVESDFLGSRITEELVAYGAEKQVTNENKLQYIHLIADWHVNVMVGRPAKALAAGLSRIIPITWLRLFSPHELNSLLNGGDGIDIDIEDLKKHTVYSGGYSEYNLTIRFFWKEVSGFSTEERAALLKFVTSCSRPPLGGFCHLQPPFTIHKIDVAASPLVLLGGKDVALLPSASTCFNMLKLPNYRRPGSLRKKLLMAITASTGFGLS